MKLKLDLNGGRRLTENVILEVRAAADRLGLEIEKIEFVRQPAGVGKIRDPASPPKAASRRRRRTRG